jgi:hypothetical protein
VYWSLALSISMQIVIRIAGQVGCSRLFPAVPAVRERRIAM